MTIFEYLMVLVSIVLALGFTQLLRGFGKIVRSERPYPALTWWAVTLAFIHVQVWWSYWDFRVLGESEWTQLAFFFMVLPVTMLYASVDFLVPSHATHEMDWEGHFFRVRRWFYGVLTAFILVAITITRVLLDVPLTHPYRIQQLLLCGVVVAGFFVSRRRVHVWLAIGFLTGFVGAQAVFRLFPGL